MTRALVVWEDKYFESLDAVTKRLVRALASDPGAAVPTVLSHTTRGNGAFERYVRTTWPKVQPRGLPIDPRSFDHLVCVVDGDRLHDLLRGQVSRPPAAAADVPAWHTGAERTWQTYLRGCCDPAGPAPATVHGVVLRWARESAALAGYDLSACRAALDLMADDGVAKVLAQCAPRPTDVADERFTDTFRKPLECLRMLRADRALDKTAPEIDDAIKALARHGLPVLRARVPDLGRIAELVWGLHRGTEQPL